MSPEPFDSRAKAPPAKRWEKGYGNENVVNHNILQPRSQGLSSYRPLGRALGGKMRDPGNEVELLIMYIVNNMQSTNENTKQASNCAMYTILIL